MPWKQISFSKNEWQRINSEIKLFKKRTRFLIDENVPDDLTMVLKEKGYNTKTITEFGLRGRDDLKIFDLARKENRVLITQDKDFLNEPLAETTLINRKVLHNVPQPTPLYNI